MAMNEREALGYIREKAEAAPDLEPTFAELACRRWMERRDPPYREVNYPDVKLDILDRARRVQSDHEERMTSEGGGGDAITEGAAFALSRDGLMMSERLREAVRPWVEQVREEVEERAGVELPLPDLGAAVDWIEEVGGVPGHDGAADGEPAVLPYARPGGGWVRRVATAPGGQLHPLARDLGDVAEATGFREVELVGYVLAGERPLLMPATVHRSVRNRELPDGTVIQRPEVQLTLRTADLTVDELRALHGRVRDAWGAKKTGDAPEWGPPLRRTVQEVDGSPGDYGFWPEVAKRMEEKGWGGAPDTWGKRWRRLMDRQERLTTIIEAEEE